MARVFLILCAMAALANAFSYTYFYTTASGAVKEHFNENDDDWKLNLTSTWPWPGTQYMHLSCNYFYGYNTADGNIWQHHYGGAREYSTTAVYNPSVALVNIGAGKTGVHMVVAESLNTLWWFADSSLWTCTLNACPTTKAKLATVAEASWGFMQLMRYNSKLTIVLRQSSATKHRAYDASTGSELDADKLETFSYRTSIFKKHTTYVQGRVMWEGQSTLTEITYNGDTVFSDRSKVGNINEDIRWLVRSSGDRTPLYHAAHGASALTEISSFGLVGSTSTIEATTDAMNPDCRFDLLLSGTCGNGVCDSTETHENCNVDCCPAGVAAFAGLRGRAFCNVTCGAGHYIPAGSRGQCDAFLCPAGYVDSDNDASTACTARS